MLNLKKVLTKIITWIDNNEYLIRTITGSSLEISASSNGYINANVAYSGYTPVGILACATETGGTAQNYLFVWSWRIYNEQARVAVRNAGTSTATVTPTFTILYKKN